MSARTVTPMDEGRWHVYPVNDYREHVIDPRVECWCRPVVDEDGIVLHNAMDGREKLESGEVKLQ